MNNEMIINILKFEMKSYNTVNYEINSYNT